MDENSFKCSVCGFALWIPIASLKVSTLGLYNDGRFPGRSILALKEHREDFAELEPDLAKQFLDDAQQVGKALEEVVGAKRINYAILGNAEPHLHWHIIPRLPNEPLPNKSPWSDPRPQKPLPDSEVAVLVTSLVEALEDLKGRSFSRKRPPAHGSHST